LADVFSEGAGPGDKQASMPKAILKGRRVRHLAGLLHQIDIEWRNLY
jgi:hypothetical protein